MWLTAGLQVLELELTHWFVALYSGLSGFGTAEFNGVLGQLTY